jgi:hypothetical protein
LGCRLWACRSSTMRCTSSLDSRRSQRATCRARRRSSHSAHAHARTRTPPQAQPARGDPRRCSCSALTCALLLSRGMMGGVGRGVAGGRIRVRKCGVCAPRPNPPFPRSS